MKQQEKLIRRYYAEHNITHSATLLFSYVRKDKWGGDGAVIEYWAAKYGRVRGKKGKDIVAKYVMNFNPDTQRYSMSNSVVRYSSWSTLTTDHLIFDFHREMSGCYDYSRSVGQPTGGNRLYRYEGWKHEIMPTSEIPLNGFEGTKYQYCKYRFKSAWTCARNVHSYGYWTMNQYGSLPEYLRLFNVNPRAMEMFASRGLVRYMKESFLVRLRDDKPFAAWYRKHALEMLDEPIYRIENRARREIGKTCWEIVRNEERRLKRLREKRKLARDERREARIRAMYEEKRKNEAKTRAMRIRNLYNRFKSIFGLYGCYEIVFPKSESEMVKEGEKMHNCIGKCYPCRHGIDSIVVFLRKNGKPCVDVEIDPATYEVKQCRFTCNANADEETWKVARRFARKMKEVA